MQQASTCLRKTGMDRLHTKKTCYKSKTTFLVLEKVSWTEFERSPLNLTDFEGDFESVLIKLRTEEVVFKKMQKPSLSLS